MELDFLNDTALDKDKVKTTDKVLSFSANHRLGKPECFSNLESNLSSVHFFMEALLSSTLTHVYRVRKIRSQLIVSYLFGAIRNYQEKELFC